MGIRFQCPNGHKLNVKSFLAGKRGICPECDARFIVPMTSGERAEEVAQSGEEPLPASPTQAEVPEPQIAPAPTPSVTPTISPAASPAIDPEPAIRHQRNRQRQRERVRRINLVLGGLVVVLAIALVFVLWIQG